MNWTDSKNWKQSCISTSICLLGCSIGTIGTSIFLINYNLLFVFIVSVIAGFLSCMLFMTEWHIFFRQMTFNDAVKSSYKMSIVSLLIMMITENVIMLFIAPKFSSNEMQMNVGNSTNYTIMISAMLFGFIFSLPYNYYQVQKTGKICH